MSDISLVEENFFSLIEPRLDEFVDRYYWRLFDRYPGLRSLFQSPPEVQKEHFGWSLRLIVANLRNPGSLESLLETLGSAHVGYGVGPDHFSQVRENLIATLREASGCSWTQDLEQAWEGAYETIVDHFYVSVEKSAGQVGSGGVEAQHRGAVDLFKIAEEYLGLMRQRRATGVFSETEAARSEELRVQLEAQLQISSGRHPERRRDMRVPATSCVDFQTDDMEGSGRLITVSERGMFIGSTCQPDSGQGVEVTLYPDRPGERPLRVRGTVVWKRTQPNAAGPAGIAIGFDDVDEGIIALLERRLYTSLGFGPARSDDLPRAAETEGKRLPKPGRYRRGS